MLCLSEKDILHAASLDDFVNSAESAMVLYERGVFHMPDRTHVDFKGNTLLLMPCFTEESLSTKLVTLFPQNAKNDLPILYGVVVLNDGRTGEPLAILNGSVLTAVRTGAVSSVSIRHLTPETAQTLGIVGAGVQGEYQARVACSQRNFSDIFIYDILSEKAANLAEKLLEKIPGTRVHPVESIEKLLETSQVVITATTSKEPVLPDNKDLFKGKHIIGIGSYKPDMKEFPPELYKIIERIYIDTDYAVEESGDLVLPLQNHWIQKNQILTLGKHIVGEKREPLERGETTVFKSVGMALFDLVISEFIYKMALQKGLGKKIDL
jgi:ornithine cyclodeaminase